MYDISDSEWRQMVFFSVEDDFFFVADDFFSVEDDFFLVADDFVLVAVMSSVTSVAGAVVFETTFQTRWQSIVTLHLFSPLCIFDNNKASIVAYVI